MLLLFRCLQWRKIDYRKLFPLKNFVFWWQVIISGDDGKDEDSKCYQFLAKKFLDAKKVLVQK